MKIVTGIVAAFIWSAAAQAAVTVPFVGCAGDDDTGPTPAATGRPVTVEIPAAVAAKLAVYSGEDIQILAPRGWDCAGFHSNVNASLSVFPPGRDDDKSGPIVMEFIKEGNIEGGLGSGVISVGATYFPDIISHSDLLDYLRATNMSGSEEQFAAPVYSSDELTYLTKSELIFFTPAGKQGVASIYDVPPSSTLPTRGILRIFYPAAGDKSSAGVGYWAIMSFAERLPAGEASLGPYMLNFVK